MIYKTLSDLARGYFLPFLTHDTFSHTSIQLLTCNHLQLYSLYPCDSSLVYSRSEVRGIFLKLKAHPIIPLIPFKHFPFFLEYNPTGPSPWLPLGLHLGHLPTERSFCAS